MILTIDIGGTKMHAALFDGRRLLAERRVDTCAWRGQEAGLGTLMALADDTLAGAGVERPEAVSVACAGSVSCSRGVIVHSPLVDWRDVPVSAMFEERYRCPASLLNDADAAAYGEYRLGAGRGASSLAYITVSTGLGCGLVLGGDIWHGSQEEAGELGHLNVVRNGRPCACGRRGCLETYASGTSIALDARALLASRGQSAEGFTAKEAAEAARAGDAEMKAIFDSVGDMLGYGISVIRTLLDVERVVLGGSVIQSFDLLKPCLVARTRESVLRAPEADEWIRTAALWPNAELYGAGIYACERLVSKENG